MTSSRSGTDLAPDAVVVAFYDVIGRRDTDGLAQLVETAFGPNVVLVLPDSLPYGGVLRGSSRVRRALLALAASPDPIGPHDVSVTSLCTAATDAGYTVAVELEFTWFAPGSTRGIASGAVEVWTFDPNGLVTQIRAYYADTAALVAATHN